MEHGLREHQNAVSRRLTFSVCGRNIGAGTPDPMQTLFRPAVLLLVFVAAVGLSATPARREWASQITPLAAPQLWQRAEFRVAEAPTAANNFDPDLIKVDATFTAPSGRAQAVPAFWFQDYSRALVDGAEVLTAVGTPEWRVRFTPTEPGEYAVSVTAALGGAAPSEIATTWFKVAPKSAATARSWVKIGADGRYLATTDDKPLRLVGENVCWAGARGTYDYDLWFPGMKSSGQNFARLWLAPWFLPLEHKPGTLTHYDLGGAWQLDRLFDLAERDGLYLLLCFDHHGMYQEKNRGWGGSNNFWLTSNPYSAKLGGPCATPNDFFTATVAKKAYQKRLRYLVARYGASPRLLSWQFFNEIDNVFGPGLLNGPDVIAWHREMAQWLRAADPFKHLISTSLTGGVDRPELWSIPEMDFAVYHSYAEPAPGRFVAAVADSFVNRYRKPALIGEFGTSAANWAIAGDPHLRGFRQGLWGGALGGSMGTAMSWWWEDIHTDNAYPLYTALNTILRRAGWQEGEWQPVRFAGSTVTPAAAAALGEPLPGGETFSGPVALNHFRRLSLAGEAVLTDRLSAERTAESLCGYIHGSAQPDKQQHLRLTAHFGPKGKVTFHVNSVAATATLVVRLDGAEALRVQLVDTDGVLPGSNEINQEFSIDAPAGRHSIEITHDGTDWIQIDALKVEQVRPAAYAEGWRFMPERVGLRQGNKAVLHLTSPFIVWPAGALRFNPPVQKGETVTLTDWPAGGYSVQWFDPSTATMLTTTQATATGGTLTLILPDFAEDLAAIVEPTSP